MKTIIRVIDFINDWVGKIASFLMIPLVGIGAFEVISRYVFNKPTIWAWEVNTQVFAAIIMLGGGYTFLHDGHIRVDVLTNLLSERARLYFDLLTPIFLFSGMYVIVVYGWKFAYSAFEMRETFSTILGSPSWPMKMLIPIGGFFLSLQGISEFLKTLIKILHFEDKE